MKIGYQGVKGAFSETALKMWLKSISYSQDYEEVCYSSFVEMLADVEAGKTDFGMFPVENTTTGIIARTYDHFRNYDIHVVGEVVVPIRECLIGIPGTKIEEIREVYSHPEALSQCQELFVKYPWMQPHAHEDTALSVSYIRDLGDHTKAALASELAAETYGMEILEEHVQDNELNMTRFFCMTSKDVYADNADKVSIRMVTGHTPGALYNALGIFAALNINVLKLESRPIFGRAFEYCFYLDFARYDCRELDVFGDYKAAIDNM